MRWQFLQPSQLPSGLVEGSSSLTVAGAVMGLAPQWVSRTMFPLKPLGICFWGTEWRISRNVWARCQLVVGEKHLEAIVAKAKSQIAAGWLRIELVTRKVRRGVNFAFTKKSISGNGLLTLTGHYAPHESS